MSELTEHKLASALRKLTANGREIDDLPVRDNSNLWTRVETACRLSDQELSRLKNYRCPLPGNLLLFRTHIVFVYRSYLIQITTMNSIIHIFYSFSLR